MKFWREGYLRHSPCGMDTLSSHFLQNRSEYKYTLESLKVDLRDLSRYFINNKIY